MKWKFAKPIKGDRRTVRRFAWFPVAIEDTKVWLETYETVEEVIARVDRYGERYLSWFEVCNFDYETRSWVYPMRRLL